MPRFNTRGQVVAGVGDGIVSIDRVEVARGGGACWLNDYQVIYGGHWDGRWALLTYDTRTGQSSFQDNCEVTGLVGSGGYYFAQGSNKLSGNIPYTAQIRLTPTSTDGRGAADRNGHIALSDLTGQGFTLAGVAYEPGIACYDLTVVGPGQAFYPRAGTFQPIGLPPLRTAGAPGRGCYCLVAGRAWLVYYLADVGLVAHPADDASHLQIIEARPIFFHYDAIAFNGTIRVTYATTAAEAPDQIVIRDLDLSQLVPVPVVVVPLPPDPIPQTPEPHPMALGITDAQFNTLVAVRSKYGETLDEAQIGALLNEVAWIHRSEGVGMQRKDGGTNATQPRTGIKVWRGMRFAGDIGQDVLGAASIGKCVPVRGFADKADPNTFVAPVEPIGAAPPPDPEPVPIPNPPPATDLEARVHLLEQTVSRILTVMHAV